MQLGCDPTRRTEFSSAISMGQVGGLKVANVSMSPQTLCTQGRLRAPKDVLMIKIIDEGTAVFDRDGEQCSLGTGGLIVVDPAQPFQEHAPVHARLLVVNALKSTLRQSGYKYQLTRWVAPDASSLDIRLVRDMIRLIASHSPELNLEMRTRLGCQLLDLMDVVLHEDATPQAETVRLRVDHYIMQNLPDTTLDAAEIASNVNLCTGFSLTRICL